MVVYQLVSYNSTKRLFKPLMDLTGDNEVTANLLHDQLTITTSKLNPIRELVVSFIIFTGQRGKFYRSTIAIHQMAAFRYLG